MPCGIRNATICKWLILLYEQAAARRATKPGPTALLASSPTSRPRRGSRVSPAACTPPPPKPKRRGTVRFASLVAGLRRVRRRRCDKRYRRRSAAVRRGRSHGRGNGPDSRGWDLSFTDARAIPALGTQTYNFEICRRRIAMVTVTVSRQLSQRRSRFVDEYLLDQYGSAAAVRAGYSQPSAKVTASRLLTNANVRSAINERQVTPLMNCGCPATPSLSDF